MPRASRKCLLLGTLCWEVCFFSRKDYSRNLAILMHIHGIRWNETICETILLQRLNKINGGRPVTLANSRQYGFAVHRVGVVARRRIRAGMRAGISPYFLFDISFRYRDKNTVRKERTLLALSRQFFSGEELAQDNFLDKDGKPAELQIYDASIFDWFPPAGCW